MNDDGSTFFHRDDVGEGAEPANSFAVPAGGVRQTDRNNARPGVRSAGLCSSARLYCSRLPMRWARRTPFVCAVDICRSASIRVDRERQV